ncbi:MAG: peroxiredoxin family protein [Gemmatimonadales bacterium]
MRLFKAPLSVLTLLSVLVVHRAGAQEPVPANGPPTARFDNGPEVGQRPRDFSLPWANQEGIGQQWFSLSGQQGSVVVLLFYPLDFTPTCTVEMKTLSEQYDSLFPKGVVVAAVSADSLDTHLRFAQSIGVQFKLLSDVSQSVSRQFSSADQGGYNFTTAFVINRKGVVTYRDLQFNARKTKSYQQLKKAVAAAVADTRS